MIHQQNFVRRLLNGAGDALAVLPAEDKSTENEQVKRALEQGDAVGGFAAALR
jgi:hypothetical protein